MIAVREDYKLPWIILRDEDITHIEQLGEGQKTYIHTIDKKTYEANVNLIHYEGLIDETVFFRAHRNKYINVKHHLKKIFSLGINRVEFSNGVQVDVSRRQLPSLIKFCNPVSKHKFNFEEN